MKITIPSRLTAPPISVSTSPAVPGASNAGIIITAADQPQPQQGDGTSLGDARNSSMSTSTSTSTSLHLGKRKRASNAPASASEMDLVESNQAAAPTTSKGGRTLAAQLYETMRDYTRDERQLSHEFMHLPPREHFPDYYSTIKKPIAFAEIRAKLDAGVYDAFPAGTKAMADDFHQMFVNAKRYNLKGSPIFNDAKRLDKLVKETYQTLTGLSFDGFGEGGQQQADEPAAASAPAAPAPATVAGPKKRGRPPKYPQAQHQPHAPAPVPSKKAAKAAGGEEKPVTLTKWLTNKVDDLVALTDASGRQLAPIFLQLPPQEQYPDYYALITRPVSFQLVRSRLKNRNYPTIQKFVDDVNAIFDNAMYYNEEHSQVWEDAAALKERFAELMREPAPEFHVRPRNKDQQLTSAQDMRFHPEGAQGQGQITLHMGSHGAIENIAFADEWDDEAPFPHEAEAEEEAEEEQKPQPAPAPAPVPAAVPQARAKPPPQQVPRILSRLPSASAPALISAFSLSLVPSGSTVLLANDRTRQHALTIPGAVERIDITPLLLRPQAAAAAGALKIQMRPAHSVAEVPNEQSQEKEEKEEAKEAEAEIRWLTRPQVGLNTYEILNTQEGMNGLYRIFVTKCQQP